MSQDATTSEQLIELKTDRPGAMIRPELFGHLHEPYGTSEDAIWVGDSAEIPHEDGLRLDMIESLRRLRVPLLRWPGGTVADTYHWQDGIGPRDQRPRTWSYFFGGEDDNQFGTDEFLRLCELLGAVAVIKTNAITADLDETLQWMQYCNYKGGSRWSRLRSQNGHAEPYGVRYWQIGNEASDAFSPERYAELVHQRSYFMRQVDPDARIIVTGCAGGDWNELFLKRYTHLLKRSSVANRNMIHLMGLKYPSPEHIEQTVAELDQYLGAGEVDIAVEEWRAFSGRMLPDAFYDEMTLHERVLKQGQSNLTYEGTVDMEASILCATRLHMLMRYARRVKLASFLYPTNAWGPMIKTNGSRFLRTSHYHVFDMLKEHMGATLVDTETNTQNLDVIASVSDNNKRTHVSIVNPFDHGDVRLRLRTAIAPSRGTASILAGQPTDENTFDKPDVLVPQAASVEIHDHDCTFQCPSGSVTSATLEL